MKINCGRLFIVLMLNVVFFLPGISLHPESGIYDRLGIWPESGYHGAFPGENPDLFTGGLCLKFLDIWLPGPNGFDIKLWRCYNSKVLRDRLPGSIWGIQAQPYSYCGMGWSMHMGRVHNYNGLEPIIEFPDGRWETAYPNANGSDYISRGFLKYDKANYKLYFLDGTVWTLGLNKTITYVGHTEEVRVVTKIENSYGHSINITYQSGSNPALKTITDSMGRTINFVLSNNRLDYISVKNTNGGTIYYQYTVGTYPYGGYYQLQEYDPPEIPASTYEYNSGQYDRYELTAVNTSVGGRIEYEYQDHTFFFKIQPLETRVLKKKRIRFNAGEPFKEWTYSFPDYYSTDTGTVTVDGPHYDTNVTFHALSSSNPYDTGWKVGLIKKKWFTDNSYSEDYEWEYQQISNNLWLVLNINLGPIRAPLQQSITTTRLGDAESKEEFLYQRTDVKNYGLPTRVNVYAGTSGTTLKHYKTLQYYFETNATYRSRYLIDYVKNEAFYSSGGSKLKETKTDYYTSTGKYGAIDQIQRWRSGSTYLTWDYTYSSSNPNDITITINLPGSLAGTETYRYRYGVLAEKKRPGYSTYELYRTISSYNSAIKNETNQHNGTMTFTYDNLDRIKYVDMPSGFNDIDIDWNTNNAVITQTGGSTITKYWDGMGRDTGYTETGDGTTLYFRKTLDAEARVVSESKGSNSSGDTYDYVLNAAGNPTKITDPRSKITNISYIDDQKTVTDANQKQTVFYYEGLAGLFTRLKDPNNKYADYTYDAIGRLTKVIYNSARTREYSYDGLDQVTWESHPETGDIDYTYNNENNLWKKTWGGVILEYKYKSDNQIYQIITGEETITYDYDTRARVAGISGTKGWSRDSITYNSLGSLTNERQNIPGLGLKTISYTYDNNNNLRYTNSPDGKTADITNNTLNMPENIKFNNKTLVNQATYGHNKQPTYMNIYGNGTIFNASYDNNGALFYTDLKKGGTFHYKANYGYDNVGNITSIYNTVPSFNASFVYDNLYRLYTASYTGGKSYNFTYDDYGNLKTAKENNITVFSKTFNSNNRISSSGFTYDNRGNLKTEPGYQYVWSRQNYLTDIKDGVGTLLSTHLYNERGLRLRSGRLPASMITVQSPNGGESYYVGSNVDITWSSSGIVGNVKIEYSTNNGSSWTEITASTANDNHYAWTAPATPSSSCLVRVSEMDGSPSDTSDAVFTIAQPPWIDILTPNGGEQLEIGAISGIQWSTSAPLVEMKVEYSTNNGSTWTTLVESTSQCFYDWTIPNEPSNNCLVRVTHIPSGVFDVSDAVFTIYDPAFITVTSPNGGESWETGSIHNIAWNTIGPVGNVKIEYSLNNGTSWNTIVSSTTNDGEFTWTVPGTTSDNCLVKITDIDNYPTDTSDGVFSIVLPPAITVTSPNGGENWETNSLHDITWTSQGLVGDVKIEYSFNHGTSWTTIISTTANDGIHPWTVPDTPSTNCLVRVSEIDGDPADTGDTVFSIVIPASITIISPNGGESWETASSHEITWTSTGTVGNVKIEFTTTNGSSWTTIVDSTANDGGYNWTIPDNPALESDNCRVRISDIDTYPIDTGDNLFSIVLPPGIFVTSPNGGESWEVGDYHSITWDSQGIVGNVNIDYSVNNGASWTTIISNTANDGSHNWWVPDDASGSCLVRVRETDGDPSDTSNGVFSIVLPAHIKVLVPNGGETWDAGSPRQITWTGPGIYNHVKIDYSINNGSTWTTVIESTPDDGTFSWTVTDTPSENCLVRIDGAFSDTDPPDTSDAVFTITSDTLICGQHWINSNYSGSDDFNSVTYGNILSLYAAVGNNGVIMTGSNAVSWTSQTSNTSYDLHGAAFGNNTFVVVGKGGKILTSPFGTTWTTQTSNTAYDLMGIAFGGNKFAAVGINGIILTSPDGISWTDHSPGLGNVLYAIAYGNNTYVAAGSSGVILTSTDGSNWTTRVSGTANTLYGITYGNNQFVVVGGSGTILTSSTGIDWTVRTSAVTTALRSAGFGGSSSIFVIVGDYGEILTAADCMNWASQSSGTGNHLKGLTFGNSKFVAVGEEKIIYSTCGPMTPTITLTSPNGGETWSVGVSHDITWTWAGSVGNVKIDYSVDNGSNWIAIAASTANDGAFAWTIPDNPSADCLVRVSEIDGSPLDTSDAVFSIITGPESGLRILSPNGGETLNTGDIYDITWTSTGTVGNVLLEYSLDSGVNWTVITSSTVNDGGFDWTVPDIAFTSDYCLVRVSEADEDRKPSDTSDAEFTIISPGIDSLTITSPNGREILTAGSDHDITWTSTGTVGNIKIEYSIDSGDSWEMIEDSTGNDGSFTWTVPDTVSDHCLVRISENDEDGTPVDASDAEFSIISSGSASLILVSPNGGEQLAVGSVHVITWTGNGEISEISLEYSTDNGVNWLEIAGSAANSGSFDWTIPDAISDTCLVRISEVGGVLSDTSDGVFSIIEQPSIIVLSPNGGETWEAGSVYPVTWQSNGDVGLVNIEYSIDNGVNWIDMAPLGQVLNAFGEGGAHELHELTRIAAQSSYDWLVPDTPSDACLVRISGGSDVVLPDTSDSVFTIVSPVNPILTVNYPNGGETLVIGNTYEITWGSYGTVGEVKIEYSVDSGTNWTDIIASTENDGGFEWLVPDTASDTCLVRVSETDDDPVDVSDAVFTIAVPSTDYITVTSPNGGEVLTAGGSFDITWDSSGAFPYVNIEYSIDDGVSWAAIVISTANDGNYTWGVPVVPSDLCLVRIRNSDRDNEPSDVSDGVFSIVSQGPVITVTSPNGAEGLVIGTTHDITWIGTVDITLVDIEYSIDNGGNWVNIVSATENDGSYTWTIPDKESEQCLVRISDSDADNGVSDVSNSVFSIVKDEPPACGGSWSSAGYSGLDAFYAVTYGGGKFVAVGNNGMIKTSSDGINWNSRTSNTTADLYGIAYGFQTYTVVGENGTALNSTDGINWTLRATGTGNKFYGITYGNIWFIAVGVNGTIFRSVDGVFWTDYSLNISQTFYGAVYGNGMFVVVGGGGIVFTSPDGTNWTQRSSGTSQALRGVTYGDNQFVAVGDNGVILTSADGINWTSRISSINVDLLDAVYGDGVYVVVGNSGKILTSSDGVYWDSQSSGVRGNLSGVVFGNSRFVAVGAGDIIYSICNQTEVASSLNNKKFLEVQKPFYKKVFGRRRQSNNDMTDRKVSLQLLSPNGNDILQAGEKFLITWKSEPNVEKVKLEYSPDNGSTYLPIAVDVANTGHYEWLVPHHVSSHCLVRVSEVKEKKMPPHGLVYEMDFSVNGAEFSGSSDSFTIYLGDAADESIKNNLPWVSFFKETNGMVYIRLNDNIKEIGSAIEDTHNASRGKRHIKKFATENTEDTEQSSLTPLTSLTSLTYHHGFNDRWHNVKIFMDNVYDRISVILDGVLMFESVPRSPMAYFSPALSFSVGPGHASEVEIDDVVVRAFYSQEDKNQWITLFNEGFERLKEKNYMQNSGWRTKSEQAIKDNQKESGKNTFAKVVQGSEQKTLNIKTGGEDQFTVVKHFNIPVDFPFDTSDKTFEIRYNDSMYSESAAYDDAYPRHGGHSASANNFYSSSSTTIRSSTPGRSRTSQLFNTYYIYTFDGKLLAEYDHNGNCVRDYIYFGNRLIAEYKPQTNEYFYYMTDQINSTRIITNDSGDIVFSEAYGPYGDVQKTWTNTYDPRLKFSGKEREGYSDLDYFGARYYDHKSYRFNSVDPVINRVEALYNPQLWNLYAYCRNNPITFFDPDGREEKSIWQQFKEFINPAIPQSNIIPDIIIINGKTMTTGQAIDEAVEMAIDIEKGNYFEELLADLIEAGGEPVIKKPGTRVNKDGTPKSAEDQLTQIEQNQKLLRKQRKENYKKEIENNKQKSIDSIEKSKQNVKDMLKKNKGNKDDV